MHPEDVQILQEDNNQSFNYGDIQNMIWNCILPNVLSFYHNQQDYQLSTEILINDIPAA